MGVITESDVDYGKIYGPFPSVGHIPKSHFIGYLTSDERHETGNVKINLNDAYLGTTWMPYVQPARTMEEQNMEAYMKDGHIFYRTLQIIKGGEELFVWYSKDFAQILGIPAATITPGKEDEPLRCAGCGERFQYQYSLMAHSRFRCPLQTHITSKTMLPQISPPNRDDNGKERISLKRKLDSPNDVVTNNKLAKTDVTKEENNNIRGSEHSPVKELVEFEERDIGSAFRKVEKSNRIRKYSDSSDHSPTIKGVPDNNASMNNEPNKLPTASVGHMFNPSGPIPSTLSPGFPPGIGMLLPGRVPTGSSPQPFIDPRIYRDMAARLPSISKTTMFSNGLNSNVPEVMRRFPGSDVMGKQMIMEQLRKSQFQCVQTANPMVEKILQTTASPALLQRPIQSLNLAQNWCAKCNATFRMTSDLVYHMRSHHKREFDPIKKKRDDKLQCDVCKETFKERHHLTRHMTSHT